MKIIAVIILVGLLVISLIADAAEFRPIVGKYTLGTSDLVDSDSSLRPDRVIFFIEGDAAKEIFYGISQKAKKDLCATDMVSKKVGNLICSKLNSGKYFCNYGVSLRTGKVVEASAC